MRWSDVVVGVGGFGCERGGHGPFSDSVNLEIDPPHAWDAEDGPQAGFLAEGADEEPLKDDEVAEGDGEEEGKAEEEEEDV